MLLIENVTGPPEQVQIMFPLKDKNAGYLKPFFLGRRWMSNQRKSNSAWYNTPHWKIIELICCALRTKSHLNNHICQHRGMKTSTVTPSFYYFFNILMVVWVRMQINSGTKVNWSPWLELSPQHGWNPKPHELLPNTGRALYPLSYENSWRARCSGDRGFDSCRGLRFFHFRFHNSLPSLKFTIFIHLSELYQKSRSFKVGVPLALKTYPERLHEIGLLRSRRYTVTTENSK